MKDPAWDTQLTVAANNTHETIGKRQFGGTATMAFNFITSTEAGRGFDNSGLGRWTWIRLQGKHATSTTIIIAYCPCHSKHDRPETVYMQQKRYLMSKNIDTCPREVFRRDISSFIAAREKKETRLFCVST